MPTPSESPAATLTAEAREELAAYTASTFDAGVLERGLGLPLPPEPHVSAWQAYLEKAAASSVAAALGEALIQLRFPIEAGISETDTYRAATRKGVLPEGDGHLAFRRPETLRLELHDGAAGPIPVVVAGDREDFTSLVRALTMRNEPKPVPGSMGASMIAGLVNWDRIRQRREAWNATPESERTHPTWEAVFQAMVPDKGSYQDRLIVLSEGPYSNVPAAALGLEDAEWRALSHTIRLEHEYTHYFTRRVLGSMRNNLLDELIADAMGLLAATGRFEAAWFLHFVGLENHPAYRVGGRLENYRGTPPLSDAAFAGLGDLVVSAAHALERYTVENAVDGRDALTRAQLVLGLSAMTLDELAAPDGARRLAQSVKRAHTAIAG